MHPQRQLELFGGSGPGGVTVGPPRGGPPPPHAQTPLPLPPPPPFQHQHHAPPHRPPSQWVTRDNGPPPPPQRFHGGPGLGPGGPGGFGPQRGGLGPPQPLDPHALQQQREAAERLEQAAREQAERNARFGAPPPPPAAALMHPSGGFPHLPTPAPPALPNAPARGGLPLPPMPPRVAPAAATAAAPVTSGVWCIYRTAENAEYYFNSLTQKTQWTKPDELKSEEERTLPPCVWSEFKTDAGVSYYSHQLTKESVWTKPPELAAWEAARTAREVDIANRKAEQLANAPPPPKEIDLSPATVEQKMRENQAKLLAKQEKAKAKQEKEKEKADSAASPSSASPAVAATPAVLASDEPVYATKEEARAAFRSLLLEKRITSRMKNFNTDVLPLICNDARYRALKSMPERKKAYTAFLEEMVQSENETRKQREEVALQHFQAQLQETIEITHKSRFKTMLPILELDERYQQLHQHLIAERIASGSTLLAVNTAAVLDKIEEIFYKHVDELIAAEKKLAAQKREAQCEAFRALLREHTELEALQPPAAKDEGEIEEEGEAEAVSTGPRWINSHTSWRTVKKHPELTSDRRWLEGPGEDDRLDLFDAWMRHLTKIQREKDQLQREARRQVEKEKRQEFRQLLQEESNKLHLHARTRFKELLPHIKDDARYTGLIDWYVEAATNSAWSERARDRDDAKLLAGDKVKDIFSDFVEDLIERHEPLKKTLKATIVKDLQLAIQPHHTPQQLSDLCAGHPQWAAFTATLSPGDLALIWLDLIGKVNAKIHYFHSRQKDEQIKLVCKLLRTLYAQRLSAAETPPDLAQDAESLTFEQACEMVRQLRQPIAREAHAPAPTSPEEGEVEEGELPADDGAPARPASPVLVPRQHSASEEESLAAWDLLHHPPLPPPSDAPPGTILITDEYLREAFTVFHAQLQSEVASLEKKRREKEERQLSASANGRAHADQDMLAESVKSDFSAGRKRPRSASPSPRSSRSPKRTHTEQPPTTADAEEGELD